MSTIPQTMGSPNKSAHDEVNQII